MYTSEAEQDCLQPCTIFKQHSQEVLRIIFFNNEHCWHHGYYDESVVVLYAVALTGVDPRLFKIGSVDCSVML